jgi:hypothetical protein
LASFSTFFQSGFLGLNIIPLLIAWCILAVLMSRANTAHLTYPLCAKTMSYHNFWGVIWSFGVQLPYGLFCKLHNTSETLTTHGHYLSLWTHVRKPYPYEHLRTLGWQILKIDEVTTGASLSAGTSHTNESTNVIKSWEIRFYWESNPGLEVLPKLL